MGLDEPAASVAYRIQSGAKGKTGYPVSAMLLIDDKARHPPYPLRGFRRRWSRILAVAVDDGKLVAEPVLTPADGLAIRVDEDAMRASLVDELFLVLVIPDSHLGPGPVLFAGQPPSPLKGRTPAMVPTVASREEPLEIGPGPFRQLPGLIQRTA